MNAELGLKFFLAKASDVPTYVEYGAADIGIVGKDTILEEGRKMYEVLDLNTGKCRMCVAGPESARELLQNGGLIRVATKYPNRYPDGSRAHPFPAEFTGPVTADFPAVRQARNNPPR